MDARRICRLAAAAAVGGILAFALAPAAPPRAAGPLRQEAYVWQRDWDAGVRAAVAGRGGAFSRLVVLAAEIDLARDGVVRVAADRDALAAAGTEVGVAVRIGPWRGPFREDDEAARRIVGEARAAVGGAGGAPAELQLDFDAAERDLGGYARWVRAVRAAVAPVPVTITALPSWLDQPELASLLDAADGFVLQVHSLAPPAGPEAPWLLCDPDAARAAVERAARLGRPFRVALPTYGYLAAFDDEGRILGVSAEGPARAWPAGTRTREVRADPATLAGLVAEWERDRPAALAGVVWFRLPVDADRRAWRWPTLRAVMAGRRPTPAARARLDRPEPALADVSVANEGEADLPGLPGVAVRWTGTAVLAADSFHGYRWEAAEAGTGRFRPTADAPALTAGEERKVGWLRFADEPGSVDAEAEPAGGR